ncbi:hypothetical protein [Streptomyces shenzhenensis]|uniref:hypothetical protein n=1 Tax=Streptomyces shenzhenensis TaxID=943815 RepID=UPI003D913179
MVVSTAALAAAGWLPVAEAVSTGEATTSKPTVVLVHGAFADAAGWHSVAKFPDPGLQPALRPVPCTNADGAGGADLCIGPGAVTGLVEKAAASTADR